MTRSSGQAHPRRAEPRTVGSARARDPLRHDVQLLGALLGGVIWEQAGEAAYERVEELRRVSIGRRRARPRQVPGGDPLATQPGARDDPETLARAFTLFLLLTNLAEEKQRVRVLARRARSGRPLDESAEAAARALRSARLPAGELDALIDRLEILPVLTAHPTEARRRTVLTAQRRLARLVDRLDDPRLTATEDAEIRAALREELTVLWQTAVVRDTPPTPLDEVRSAMAIFDETLFTAVPKLYRALERGLHPGDREHPTRIRAFLRLGSWIGGDRDGHPSVTAAVTIQAARIQSDHLLRAYEAVAHRLLSTLSMSADPASLPAPLVALLHSARRAFPVAAADLESRYPGQPYRWAIGLIRERLRATRLRLIGDEVAPRGAYGTAGEVRDDIATLADALVANGAARVAHGSVQDFAWQIETFGLHLASLELRQHAAVHRAALEALEAGGALDRPLPVAEAGDVVSAEEVLDTLRAAWEIQSRIGEEACHRYVISFTERPDDVLDVLDLARRSRADDPRLDRDSSEPVPLDVVPLFESATALDGAGALLGDLLRHPQYRVHLARRGDRQEVMLGYSDSNRELGFLGAAWALYRAQVQLVETARKEGVELLLFHGRGGALGRGGGPANRAVVAQPPGSVNGRLKMTQQGEVVASRFADPRIALRELEQLTHAAIVATIRDRSNGEADGRQWWGALDELAADARAAYRALVWDEPCFDRFFAAATPIGVIAAMQLGSRPASRAPVAAPSVASVRAIPWVFAWSQSRVGLPSWFGFGSALAAYRDRHGPAGMDDLGRASASWPFLASLLDGVAVGLAVADIEVGATYAALAGDDEPMRRIWQTITDEHARSVRELLAVTGRSRLLEAQPWLEERIALRNPYVDALSAIQRDALAQLAADGLDDKERHRLERLAQLTISGVAAGLQHTG
ncbi:MAG: phosphoenolpyruvate carboxylase [Chloroflexota bacterium]|nr:phosphoenolpyruvate carboxylase [Chloroflexota bacterium]